ncbi:MAG TPA: hypothetical protein VFM59_04585 [Salinimicrobium sp.]|nr:hypothetical protein [Salinimicrobium sp.]
MNLYKILKYLAIVIGLIGLFFLGRVLLAGDDAITNSADLQGSVLTPLLYLSYIILAIAIGLVLIFMIKGLFSGNIKNTLIAVGGFVLIVVLAYLFTDGAEMQLKDGSVLSASASHWVSAGLVTFYIMATIAILVMLTSGVKKLMK